jgi:DNA-binding MarR family transcriptional regulator
MRKISPIAVAGSSVSQADDIYRMPGHLIRRLHQISTALFGDECAAFDLTSVQYAALVMIGRQPNLDATRLSYLIAFDRSTIGGVLDRLEAKGWVLREPSPDDRRVKLLRLTQMGSGLLDRVQPAVLRVQERLLAPLSPTDRTTMVRLLGTLTQVHNDMLSAPLRLDGVRQS